MNSKRQDAETGDRIYDHKSNEADITKSHRMFPAGMDLLFSCGAFAGRAQACIVIPVLAGGCAVPSDRIQPHLCLRQPQTASLLHQVSKAAVPKHSFVLKFCCVSGFFFPPIETLCAAESTAWGA